MPATVYVEFFRGVPLVMVIFWIWFIIPQLLRLSDPRVRGGADRVRDLRGGLLRRDRAGGRPVGAARPGGGGHRARADAPRRRMRYVVLPQALKNMVPSLVTQMIVLFKDTSLASIIGFMDLTKAAQIVNNREIRPLRALPLHRGGVLDLHVLDVPLRALRWRRGSALPERRPAHRRPPALAGGRRRRPGPPVVWIHGGSVEDSSLMVADLEPFFDRVRALLPGHARPRPVARASSGVEDYTYARKAEDLLLVARRTSASRARSGAAPPWAPRSRCGSPSTRRSACGR